ncbi:MAG TPA: hypothetical protein VHX86_01820 [Tepidisphaeraceae bacterium]|nr:hypothetical protein [Tepidisphaeraceae bacterium]
MASPLKYRDEAMVSQPESPEKPEETRQRPEDKPPSADPFAAIRETIAEMLDYFLYYLSARIDSVKFAIKKQIFAASTIAVAVLAGAGAIVTAVVLLCEGLCDGLSELLGRRWAGELATGGILVILFGVGAYVTLSRLVRRSHQRMIAKYEAMQKRHEDRFGHGAGDKTRDKTGAKSGASHG